MPEKRLRDIPLVCVKLAEELVCQRINDILVSVIDIGTGKDKVHKLAFLVAQKMQFESHIPTHRTFPFRSDILEDFHVELTLVVNYRYAGAVNETDTGAFSETSQFQGHCHRHEAARHYLHKTVV